MESLKNRLFITVLFILLSLASVLAEKKGKFEELNIIPKPQMIVHIEGKFEFNEETNIIAGANFFKNQAEILREALRERTDKHNFPIVESPYRGKTKTPPNSILLSLDKKLPNEAYRLEITPRHIVCTAASAAGIFYGIQTILQLTELKNGELFSPSVLIEDAPLYSWRGMQYDASSVFCSKEELMRHLELMGHLKLNRFYWPLNDEKGWRVELKSFSDLVQYEFTKKEGSIEKINGLYSQEDVKELVEFAGARNIMIIPFIDFSVEAVPFSAKEADDKTLDKALSEIATLFPAPYVFFKFCDFFANDPVRLCEILNSKGKKMIAENVAISAGLLPDQLTVLGSGVDTKNQLKKLLEQGAEVISSFSMSDSLEKVYRFPDSTQQFSSKSNGTILGLQVNVFVNSVALKKGNDSQVFSYLLAVSEAGWTGTEKKEFANFGNRMTLLLNKLKAREAR